MYRGVRSAQLGLVVLLTVGAIACARSPGLFSEQNARAHVNMLAGTIGSRPIGTPANQRAREYIVSQLALFGLEVRVQETDARRPELGRTARVANIIATLPGERREAIGLVAHYDSRPDAPGATDDALGVAVVLETARVLAARTDRRWSLLVLLTDGEEAGLMGAAALVTDRDVMARMAAYLQIESIGSAGTALLFETGPENAWLIGPWARRAPNPRGASYAVEIYNRLPNDTDFSVLKRQGVPGLNFAPVGDSYAYHTARDTPERLSPATIRSTGENLVGVVQALNSVDITRRSTDSGTFFDIGGIVGVSYGAIAGWVLAGAALALGVIAWVRVTAAAVREAGLLRWLLTVVWSAFGAVASLGAMVGVTWALRAARQEFHPWYARPGRLFALLLAAGLLGGWTLSRAGYWLPRRAHGLRHPVIAWSVTLPVWCGFAVAALFLAPGAAFLWLIPLVAAGLLLVIVRPLDDSWTRAVAFVVFAVAAILWARDANELLHFLVTVFGRLPVVTPVYVYAVVLWLAGLAVVPPLIAAFAPSARLVRPSILTSILLLGVAVTAGVAYNAPAYTSDAPLRRTMRAVQIGDAGNATWEVGSTEPGLDLGPGAPSGWTPSRRVRDEVIDMLPQPFVFRTSGPGLGAAPVQVTQAALQPVAGGLELTIAVMPRQPGLTVAFVLPPGVVPARHNLPGVVRNGSWRATFTGVPGNGVLFRASFDTADAARIGQPAVLVTSSRVPGGTGWQSLPEWLPQERMVWSAGATWILPGVLQGTLPAAGVSPVALR